MRRAQVSIYIIIAIILIVLLLFLFFIQKDLGGEQIPQELMPVFDYYFECIKSELTLAASLAGAGGGRIFVKDYVPGSEYAPFSSHLNFFGSPVEYWYYLSGNGVVRQNVPRINEIEKEIARFVEEGVARCDFEYFYRQGFSIELGDPMADVEILERKIKVSVDSNLRVSKGDISATKDSHQVEIDSKLGKFYSEAVKIYDRQMREAFLENYTVDVLYNYAPVTGVEIQCGPKIWLTNEVIESLKNGLQENIMTIKLGKGDYILKDKRRNYFVRDIGVDESVNLMYVKDWPSRFEIHGDGVDDSIMIAKPIGNEAGIGIIGFCYVPYQFIYDISFPVMVQIFDSNELFQFPVVVIVDKNMPRKGLAGAAYVEDGDFRLCDYMTQELEIRLYDQNLNEVDGNVSFECFTQRCRLGETANGILRTYVPACVNGYLHVRASGFAEKKSLVSSNRENFVEIILERERELDVELQVEGRKIRSEIAIVSFTRDDGKITTIAMPEQDKIKLSEGSYEVKVYVYGNSSIRIPESRKTECVEVPRRGLLGLLGQTKEECFDITIPATTIENSLVGGGISSTYLLDNELKRGVLRIRVNSLPRPTSLEQLSQNFEIFETKRVWLEFDDK